MCKNNQFSLISWTKISAILNFTDGCQSRPRMHSMYISYVAFSFFTSVWFFNVCVSLLLLDASYGIKQDIKPPKTLNHTRLLFTVSLSTHDMYQHSVPLWVYETSSLLWMHTNSWLPKISIKTWCSPLLKIDIVPIIHALQLSILWSFKG